MTLKLQSARAAIFVAAAIAGTVAFASSAIAQERPVTIYGEALNAQTERVSFAKLDLADARDLKRLKHRVGAAVERVCLRDVGRDGLQDRGFYACKSKAWNEVAPQIAQAVSRASNIALGGAPLASTAIRVRAS